MCKLLSAGFGVHESITANMGVGYAALGACFCGAGVRNVNICNSQLGIQHCEKCKDYIYALRCDHIIGALVSIVHGQIDH